MEKRRKKLAWKKKKKNPDILIRQNWNATVERSVWMFKNASKTTSEPVENST